jgi:hypothetical protein
MTFDRYGHLTPGNEDEAAELLSAYLRRGGRTATSEGVVSAGLRGKPRLRPRALPGGTAPLHAQEGGGRRTQGLAETGARRRDQPPLEQADRSTSAPKAVMPPRRPHLPQNLPHFLPQSRPRSVPGLRSDAR